MAEVEEQVEVEDDDDDDDDDDECLENSLFRDCCCFGKSDSGMIEGSSLYPINSQKKERELR